MQNNTMNILEGSIWNKVILFAVPLAATSILQQLFNAVDVAVVGQFSGSVALAAVGANSSIINLLVNLFVGLSIGTNVMISTYIGQNDIKKIRTTVHTSIFISILSGIILLFIGVFFARPILKIVSTPLDIIDLAEIYLRIYFIGMPFIMLYNFSAAILRSSGDTKSLLLALLFSGVVNVILNLFFVVICHMSVDGVAIATVISNIVSSFILLYRLMHKNDVLKIDLHQLHIDWRTLKKIAKIGIPAGLQGVVFSVSNVCIQVALNQLGSTTVAANAAALNYEIIAYYVVSAFAQTAVTFIGQNYGAENYQRCRQITKQILIIGTIFTIGICLIFLVFHEFLISFFTSDIEVAKLAYTKLYVILSCEVVNMVTEILSGCLRGMGYSSIPMIICIAGICGVRITYIYMIYPHIASYLNLLIIYPISWFITTFAIIIVYYFIQKQAYNKY